MNEEFKKASSIRTKHCLWFVLVMFGKEATIQYFGWREL